MEKKRRRHNHDEDNTPNTKLRHGVAKFLQLVNCRVLQSLDASLLTSDVVIDVTTGIIVSVSTHKNNNKSYGDGEMEVMDCKNCILSPGFIDIQLNGAFGIDFSNPDVTPEDVSKVAQQLTKYGVTGFCPTMVSSSPDTYRRVLKSIGSMNTIAPKRNEICGANILGMHLEGPYFAKEKRGAHSSDCIVQHIPNGADADNSKGSIRDIYGISNIKKAGVTIVTLAPELDGALETIQTLHAQGIVVAMGHTNANLDQGSEGIKHGATLITHLFNAMTPFHHREPGLLGLLTRDCGDGEVNDCPYYSMIVDGIHSHAVSVKLAHLLNPHRAVLVTDAMCAMGMGDGRHSLGSMSVDIKGVRATIAGTDTLAGSVVSMDSCVRSYQKFCGCNLGDALRAATLHPARVMGLDGSKGVVGEGYGADLVLLDEELNVLCTWVMGVEVYRSGSFNTSIISNAKDGEIMMK